VLSFRILVLEMRLERYVFMWPLVGIKLWIWLRGKHVGCILSGCVGVLCVYVEV